MGFKIEERFEVQAPVDRVWKYLIDPQAVVKCLPGAELLEMQDENSFLGAIKVKVGPLAMTYKGKGKFTEVNEETHQVRMVGEAREVGGSGQTKVSMLSTVAALPNGGSEIVVNADVDLVGRIVQFGRGMIEEVSRQMFRQFSTCVKQQLEAVEETRPPEGNIAADNADNTNRTGNANRTQNAVGADSNKQAVAAAPLALRALWTIITRFFKRLLGKNEEAKS